MKGMKRTVVFAALVALILGLFGCTGVGPVTNTPPISSFSFTVDGLVVNFDGSGSEDSDGSIVLWQWDYGDGESGLGVISQHIYGSGGTYVITLIVTDNDGILDQVSKAVVLTEHDPVPVGVPVAFFTYTIQTDSVTVHFNGSKSYDPHVPGYADGYLNWATWTFGDGMSRAYYWPITKRVNHTYCKSGNYIVTLTVRDNEGNSSSVERYVSINKNTE